MNTTTKPLLTTGLASVLCMLVLLPGAVLAKGKKDDVLIAEIVVDSGGSSESVIIRGENLCDKKGNGKEAATLRLPNSANELSKLGCYEAGSAGNSLDELSALLPNDLERGTYLLAVDNGKKIGFMDFAYGIGASVGEQGPAGQKGPAGDTGPQGPQGEQGPAGKDGEVGATGAKGPQGDKGPDGDQGPTGVGIQGLIGMQGEQGSIGPEGPRGLAGEGCTITACGIGVTSATMTCPNSNDVQIPCPAEDLATQLQSTCEAGGGSWDIGLGTCTATPKPRCFIASFCSELARGKTPDERALFTWIENESSNTYIGETFSSQNCSTPCDPNVDNPTVCQMGGGFKQNLDWSFGQRMASGIFSVYLYNDRLARGQTWEAGYDPEVGSSAIGTVLDHSFAPDLCR